MAIRDKNRTKRNLMIFIVLVLGFAILARIIDPFTVPPGAEPGAAGLGQLLWLVAPLAIFLALQLLQLAFRSDET